jgi:hypothetical protein
MDKRFRTEPRLVEKAQRRKIMHLTGKTLQCMRIGLVQGGAQWRVFSHTVMN